MNIEARNRIKINMRISLDNNSDAQLKLNFETEFSDLDDCFGSGSCDATLVLPRQRRRLAGVT